MNTEKNKNKSSFGILKIGVLLMFFSLFVLAIYMFFNQRTSSGPISNNNFYKEVISPTQSNNIEWQKYTNKEFGINFEHPKLLFERTFNDQGGYLLFVRFEETKFSSEKGVAFGVSNKTFTQEVENVKSELEKSSAKLESSSDLNIDGTVAKRLDFSPQEQGEKRSVLIFSRDGLTFSISTVPDQMQRVIDSIDFID